MEKRILLADIGGTNIRLGIYNSGKLENRKNIKRYLFSDFYSVLDFYLKTVEEKIDEFFLAIAGPVLNNEVKLTNGNWFFSEEEIKEKYNLQKVKIVNDFVAQAQGVVDLVEDDVITIRKGIKNKGKNLVLGIGTGLGVAYIRKTENEFVPHATEGGHMAFAPKTLNQWRIFELAKKELEYVSYEKIVAASRVSFLYRIIWQLDQRFSEDETWKLEKQRMTNAFQIDKVTKKSDVTKKLTNELVLEYAESKDEIALLTYWFLFQILGTCVADLAVTLKCIGGAYLVGDFLMLPSIKKLLKKSEFNQAFFDVAKEMSFMEEIPVYLTKKTDIPFNGLIKLAKKEAQ